MAQRHLLFAVIGLALTGAAPPSGVDGPNLNLTLRWLGDHLTGERAQEVDQVVTTKSARVTCQGVTLREVTTTSSQESWEDLSFPVTVQLGAWAASAKGGGFLAVDCTLCIRVRSPQAYVGENSEALSGVGIPVESQELAVRLKTALSHLVALCRRPKPRNANDSIF